VSTLSRPWFWVLTALVLGAVVCYYRPDWAEAAGLDVWKVPALQARLDTEERRDADLSERDRTMERVIAAKQQAVDELLAGRLTLLAAAARFRDLTPADGPSRHYLRLTYPCESDDEAFCRAVIRWAGTTAARQTPREKDQLTAWLEAELDRARCRSGGLKLPE
jgi:hypothetical protein